MANVGITENVRCPGSGMLSPNTESETGGGFGASKGADTNAGGKERSPAKAGLVINERITDEAADPISALFSSLIGGRIAALFIVLPPSEETRHSSPYKQMLLAV